MKIFRLIFVAIRFVVISNHLPEYIQNQTSELTHLVMIFRSLSF